MTQHETAPVWRRETSLVHAGRETRLTDATGTPTVCPIYASTTYIHESAEALDAAFSGTTPMGDPAFVYARQANPNAHAFEDTVARAENGIGAVAFGSGMAAIHAALLAGGLSVAGTKVVASQDIYGPSMGLLRKVFRPIGVEVVMADLCCGDVEAILQAEQPDVVYVETISNPLVKLVDLDRISAVAQDIGAITIVDSTFTTPSLVRPLDHGFDIAVHSATKYISGHGDSNGGIAISAKNTLLDSLRSYSMLLGAMLSPFESHLMLRGLRTLSLRMERHCSNALQVARFLQNHPAVEHVYYPGLTNHPQHALASRLLDHEQFGGLLSFDLKEQTREATFRFIDKLHLCLPATTLGDVFSLVSYPAVSSHRTLTPEERRHIGISEGCVRLSVGIEHIEDILADLDHALR